MTALLYQNVADPDAIVAVDQAQQIGWLKFIEALGELDQEALFNLRSSLILSTKHLPLDLKIVWGGWFRISQKRVLSKKEISQLKFHLGQKMEIENAYITLCGISNMNWNPWGSNLPRGYARFVTEPVHHSTIDQKSKCKHCYKYERNIPIMWKTSTYMRTLYHEINYDNL